MGNLGDFTLHIGVISPYLSLVAAQLVGPIQGQIGNLPPTPANSSFKLYKQNPRGATSNPRKRVEFPHYDKKVPKRF